MHWYIFLEERGYWKFSHYRSKFLKEFPKISYHLVNNSFHLHFFFCFNKLKLYNILVVPIPTKITLSSITNVALEIKNKNTDKWLKYV